MPQSVQAAERVGKQCDGVHETSKVTSRTELWQESSVLIHFDGHW